MLHISDLLRDEQDLPQPRVQHSPVMGGQVHDEVVDIIVTTRETLMVEGGLPRPRGIYWELVIAEKIDAIPVLKLLKQGHLDR